MRLKTRYVFALFIFTILYFSIKARASDMTWQYKENESGSYLQKVTSNSHDEISLDGAEKVGELFADLLNRVEALENNRIITMIGGANGGSGLSVEELNKGKTDENS